MVEDNLWNALKVFTEIHKESLSSVVRIALKKYLDEETKDDLAYKMKTLTPYIDDEEQKEIEGILSKISKEDLEVGEVIKLWFMRLDFQNKLLSF